MHTPGKPTRRIWPASATALLTALIGWALLGEMAGEGCGVPRADRHQPRLPHTPLHAFLSGLGESATPDARPLTPDRDSWSYRTRLLERLGVPAWHDAGQRGRGIKVAILDSGFRDYRTHLGKALPARVTTRSFRVDGNMEARDSQHGILCAEVIHAIAPDAELLLATWEPERPDQFLEAVRWARQQGVRILSCSIIMPTWSDGEGHGPVHEALARLIGPGDRPDDALCFASAGNTAQRHWSGPFRGARNGWHEWAPGRTTNILHPWGDEPISVEMCWPPGAAYELVIFDASAGREVGRARSALAPTRCCAVVGFTPKEGHTYTVRVRRWAPRQGSSCFHLVVLGGGLRDATRQGSIPFPGDGPEVVAVGAVDDHGRRLAYSSCGLAGGLPKPDFVAAVPFPSLWRTRPFAGTSASAPQAAALAALVWSHNADWTALQVRTALRTAARHTGPGHHDPETGFGEVHLP